MYFNPYFDDFYYQDISKEIDMGRDNGGVKAKVYDNVGQGSINRGSGQEGKYAPEGGLMPVGYEVAKSDIVGNGKMNAIRGPKGSSGTVRDNGGVGDTGAGEKWMPFQGQH